MTRGRPTKLKAFDESGALPSPATPAGAPECPSHLSAASKKIWKELVRVLSGSNLLTQADVWTMERWCVAVETYREACKELAKSEGKVLTGPNGGSYQNPWLAVKNKADDQLARLSADLGLDPKSRRKMKVEAEPSAKPSGKAKYFKAREGA